VADFLKKQLTLRKEKVCTKKYVSGKTFAGSPVTEGKNQGLGKTG
jgi:hypothetical protein